MHTSTTILQQCALRYVLHSSTIARASFKRADRWKVGCCSTATTRSGEGGGGMLLFSLPMVCTEYYLVHRLEEAINKKAKKIKNKKI